MGHSLALDFLTAWTSQWDPRLLTGLGSVPEWKKIDGNSLDLEHALIVCPEVSRTKLDQPQRERLQLGECSVIDSESLSRPELVNRILNQSALASDATSEVTSASPFLCDDFYALGYAVLQIQILARKLRYSWNLDWIAFSEQAMSAAKASLAGDEVETERWLQACFDSLSQERDRYCSQQAYLLDVVLLAPSTLQASLDQQLQTTHPITLLASADLLKELQDRNPAAWGTICSKRKDKSLAIVGGLQRDQSLVHGSAKAQWRQLQRGLHAYAQLGTSPPQIYSRFGPGFTSSTPSWLSQFGYRGAMLHAWSDGKVPESDQAKIRWQTANDGKSVDTIIGHVFDASNADSYIDLAFNLAGQLDYHQVPTLVFAHWPTASIQPQKDLLRLIARSPSLGHFHTVDAYFASTSQPYSGTSFPNNAFTVSIPKSSELQTDLHLKILQYERLRIETERLESLAYLWHQIALQSPDSLSQAQEGAPAHEGDFSKSAQSLLQTLDGRLEPSLGHDCEIENQVQSLRAALLERIRKTLSNQSQQASGSSPDDRSPNDHSAASKGFLLINPANHPQRVFLKDLPAELDPSSSNRIVASHIESGRTDAIVDIPPYGFVRLRTVRPSGSTELHTTGQLTGQASAGQASAGKVKGPSLWSRIAGIRSGIAGTDWTLANEYMEVQIDPKRGHLRSMYVANKRGSRLSGMPSVVQGSSNVNRKWNDSDCIPITNVQLRIARNTPLVGTIEVTGEVKLANGSISKLVTTYTLWKGSRSLEIEIKTENLDPTQASCVWRTAWLNEGASVAAWQHGTKGKLQGPLQATVELIEIDDAEHRIYLAAMGLSSHRRAESRFLISDVPCSASGAASGRFAIGINWPRPYEMALDLCDRPWFIEDFPCKQTSVDEGAWLAQCSLPSVHMAFVNPAPACDPSLVDQEQAELLAGESGDACVLLMETQGKSGSAKLSFFRDVAKAWRVDAQGREFDSLTVTDGQIAIPIQPHEQARVLLCWKQTGQQEP